MSDVVVTVPKRLWSEWLSEGDLAAADGAPAPWQGRMEYGFNLAARQPDIEPGERVYVVAHGLLRGYAPLAYIAGADEAIRRFGARPRATSYALVRRGGAVACTLGDAHGPLAVRGFQGFRYRWWEREDEVPFPDWRTAGVS